MAHNCDYYREKAIVDGMDSQAAREWRKHSRHCRACATEIHILESLCDQATDRRQHLPRQDFNVLVETVRQLYKPAPRRPWGKIFWGLSWKVAALFIFLAAGYRLLAPIQDTYRQLLSDNSSSVNSASQPADKPFTEPFAKTFTVGADNGQYLASPTPAETTASTTEFADYDYLFAPPEHYELDDDLRALRQSVSGQIDSLEWLIDSELNGEF